MSQTTKALQSGKSFFRIDPKYGPRRYSISRKIHPASQPKKVIDENHKKEQGKTKDGKSTVIIETKIQNQNEANELKIKRSFYV